jgi:hypothetical protein
MGCPSPWRRSQHRASSIRSSRSRIPGSKIFTAGYVLVGIGILVEIARRLGMGFITARAEAESSKAFAEIAPVEGAGPGHAA